MELEDLKDKIPNLTELVENGKEVADKFEEKPKGSFVYIILVLLIIFTIYQHFDKKEIRKQLDDCVKDNKYYSHRSFEWAMQNKTLQNTVQVQAKAIEEANTYLKDSVKVVKLKQ